jgi:hypothetical protein
MKPGDLVQLVSDFTGDSVAVVEVPHTSTSGQFFRPGGSLAIFLGEKDPSILGGISKSLIFIDGSKGWVYTDELEPFDETR